jgi:hypothetical protein
MPNKAAKQRKRMKRLATKKIAEYKAMKRRERKNAKRQTD